MNNRVFVVVSTVEGCCPFVERVFATLEEARNFTYKGNATELLIFPINIGKDPENQNVAVEFLFLEPQLTVN